MMLKERVFKIISQVMDVSFEEVNESSSPENLKKWDSLQHINLILALEEEFRIKFSDEEIALMGDVGVILEVMQNNSVKE